MRNLLSFFALMISLVGVGISLTREEIRCWAGLPSNSCESSRPTLPSALEPKSPPTVRQEMGGIDGAGKSPTSNTPEAAKEVSKPLADDATDGNASEVNNPDNKKVSEIAPTAAKDSAPLATEAEKAGQPIEVVPPPADSSQPIEVIPPPADSKP